jgi:hypothetical protein
MTDQAAQTMTRPWSDIEEHYRDTSTLGPAFRSMLQLVQEIQRSRFARGLHAWTSMHELCIVQQPVSYPHDLPHLRISPQSDGRIEFRYIDTTVRERQWHRIVDGDGAFDRLALFLQQLHWFYCACFGRS